MSAHLKKRALSLAAILPPAWRRSLRRRYYLRVVKRHTDSDWEWSVFVKPLITPGSQVLDLGANVGYLTGLFARWVGPAGKVLAVEPIPATYDALSFSMKRLFPNNVTTFAGCISDTPGLVTMSVPRYEDGGENYYESRIVDAASAAGPNQFKVQATTLDLLIQNRGAKFDPDFIKIDVEGHELAVVRGGVNYLARKHPPLLIEVAGNPDQTDSAAAQLFSTLAAWGYLPHLIYNGSLRTREPGDTSVDYLFLYKGS